MDSIETRMKSLAMSLGANLVGITTTEALADGPPSADPRYLLPSANSVISFALSLDRDIVQDFISKKSWRPHCENRKAIAQTLYTIGDRLAERLRTEGYEAVNVELNNNYRPEKDADDLTEMTEFHPDFSHRYAALAAGIGRLGWSGNLLTREYGALVELGSVLTSATLISDTPIPDEKHPCDRCKMCSLVCPVEMVQPRASTQVTVAGVTETISRKRPNTCCWIGCTGYEGLASSGTWSNWSPYRLGRSLPKDKQDLDLLCISLQKADPQMQVVDNSFNDYRQAVFDPDWFYYTVCGFCRSVCVPSRDERLASRKLIINSGTAALRLDGSHVVADDDIVTVRTPFGLHVVVPREELSKRRLKNPNRKGRFPLDCEVIEHLCQRDRGKGYKLNIDELINAIRAVSDEADVQKLADLFQEWKHNKETAEDLRDTVERFIGNSWYEKDEDHKKIYKMWSIFRDEAILGIGGMTMNERLYWFCLFDEFDACYDDDAKQTIYKKLMATP